MADPGTEGGAPVSAGEEDRRWTLLLLRRGGVEAHSFRFGAGRAAAVVCAAALVLLASGVGLGLWWGERRESARVERLRGQVDRLARERSQVVELAARLDSMEAAYRQLRSVMGGQAGASERDIRLPAGPSGRQAGEGLEAAARERGGYVWPLAQRGFVTRSFGETPGAGSSGHPGLDIAVPTGSYVRAVGPGTVTEAGRDSVYGRFIRIDHADGLSTLYGHNAWLFVAEGDSVEAEEVIALSGNSGRSTAPHLHFEVRRGGTSLDPTTVLGRGG